MTPPELREHVERWMRGWSTARTLPLEELDGGWRVEMDHPARDAEIVTVDPDEGTLRRLSALAAAETRCWLTVVGTLPEIGVDERLTLLEGQEALMILDVLVSGESDSARIKAGERRARATIEIEGAVAASGIGALFGDTLVYDQILTAPEFRRRGFGRRIMSALTDWGVESGCRTGILAATVEGQALYRTIGWRALAPMSTFGRPRTEG